MAGPPPDWAKVKQELAADPALSGVEDIAVDEEVHYVTVVRTVTIAPLGQRRVPVVEERFRRSLVIRFNNTSTSLDAILRAIKATGLAVDPPVDIGQLGREIVIPPTGTG